MKKPDINVSTVLLFVSIAAALLVYTFLPAIPQHMQYHMFAHEITVFSIPNFYNVVSNLGFIFSGIWGVVLIKKYSIQSPMVWVLCVGMILTGLGSGYYHLNPTNATLVWDRLPMTIVFTSFFSEMYAQYVNRQQAIAVWIFSLSLGLFSVMYWYYTETLGQGDLRLYAIVQFLPMLLIIIICIMQNDKNRGMHKPLLAVFICYVFAKLAEHQDQYVFDCTQTISGHPIKHIFASMATALIVWMMYKFFKNDKGVATT